MPDLAPLAHQTLQRVLSNPKTPASAAVAAANAVLDRRERAIERERREDPANKTLGELTLAELDAVIRALDLKRAAQSAEDAQVIEHRPGNPSQDQ